MTAPTFNKVLVANRGEIAVRVIRSINDAGYRSVAVFSEADRHAPHVGAADEAICVRPSQVGPSYLSIDTILAAAKRTGADAIHPGYGFLSENADFAQACVDANIVFIGPSPDAIELMGNKCAAKQRMMDAGVPCIPGYHGKDPNDETLLTEALRIGFPLMIKAAAGGGGRGIRLVGGKDDMPGALASARSEALSAFGSDELILEKAMSNARHIEIQIAADQTGQTVHLGERDCSIQRRHQKVVEEAPSPFVNAELRARMGNVAVTAAQACGYFGVGTVEFLVDESGAFFFLEMNTRLQVEHPVTELVTGMDLVDWQLLIAAGQRLPMTQEDISLRGHAIEVRLYAEDPSLGFVPQTGTVHHLDLARGAGVRIDCGIKTGNDISPFYDPMLAKVIAFGASREEARRRLIRAVEDTTLLGVQTNKAVLSQVLKDPRFVTGQATTAFLDDATLARATKAAQPDSRNIALAAVLFQTQGEATQTGPRLWSNSAPLAKRVALAHADARACVVLEQTGEEIKATVAGTSHDINLHQIAGANAVVTLDGIRQSISFVVKGDNLYLDAHEQSLHFVNTTYAPAQSGTETGNGRIIANMEGQIISVDVETGTRVLKGQSLITIEAMKMEHHQLADGDGVVSSVNARVGTQVKKGQLMVELTLDIATQVQS
ncbi:MAG: biotin carboxylase N-terminal domain-containing protein [Sedimentitalea sp.]